MLLKRKKKKPCRSAVIAEAYCACCFLLTPGKRRSPPHFPISHKCFIGATTQHAESWRTLSVLSPGVGHGHPALPLHSGKEGLQSRARTACHILVLDYSVGKRRIYACFCIWRTPAPLPLEWDLNILQLQQHHKATRPSDQKSNKACRLSVVFKWCVPSWMLATPIQPLILYQSGKETSFLA